jgi:hypothetical protein
MLHNKDFEILDEFLGDYNRAVHGRELVGRVGMSQKGIALALDGLEDRAILTSERRGNMKLFRLNVRNPVIRDVLAQAETARKIRFLEGHREIGHVLFQDSRIAGIFGSYARGKEKKESDLDMFIIGGRIQEDYDKRGKPLDLDISIKYFTEMEFVRLSGERNSLVSEIMKSHVLLSGIERFINIAWRDFYGFS